MTCARRGEVKIVALSAGRIPWPLGVRPGMGNRGRALVLFGALAEAVRKESAQAVAHHWAPARRQYPPGAKPSAWTPTTRARPGCGEITSPQPWADEAR